MKLLFLTYILSFFGFSNFETEIYPPPVTVKLNDSIFIDQLSLTNLDWKEYVIDCKLKGENFYFPDTTHYVGKNNYYFNSKYDKYPVLVNSESAIENYCAWRSRFVNEHLANYNLSMTCNAPFYVNNIDKQIQVIYRIATIHEIEQALKQNLLLKDKEINQLNIDNLLTFRCVATVVKF